MKNLMYVVLAVLMAGVLSADPMVAKKKNQWAGTYTKQAQDLAGKTVPVIFLGDSIMAAWRYAASNPNAGGLEVWNREFKEFAPVNFAVSGDKVENVLWRITEGKQLDGYKARVIVVMIGVNNLANLENPQQVAKGILNLNKVILQKQPEAKIILLSVLPYGWDRQKRVEAVNPILKNSADGKKIFFMDLTPYFKDASGKVVHFRDGIHPLPEGYVYMAQKLVPEFRKLLK